MSYGRVPLNLPRNSIGFLLHWAQIVLSFFFPNFTEKKVFEQNTNAVFQGYIFRPIIHFQGANLLIQLLVDEVPALRTQSLDSQEAGVVVFMIVRFFTGEYRVGGDFYDSQDFPRISRWTQRVVHRDFLDAISGANPRGTNGANVPLSQIHVKHIKTKNQRGSPKNDPNPMKRNGGFNNPKWGCFKLSRSFGFYGRKCGHLLSRWI